MTKTSQIGSYIGGRWWRHPQLLTLPYDLWREFKAFVHRGRYGWALCDTWSLDNYLQEVMEGSLRQLAKDTHGYPVGTTADEWEAHLNEVADKIAVYRRAVDAMAYEGDEEVKAYDEMIAALHRLVDHWGNLWS